MEWGRLKVMKLRQVILLVMVLAVFTAVSPTISSADGTSVDTGKGTANLPGGEWPPAGTVAKGSVAAGAFAGAWYSFIDNTAFTIVFEQQGQLLKGAHVAVYDYGRRVDSSVGGVSLSGTIMGSMAYLEWKSGLSTDNGKATVEYLPGKPITLHWKIVDPPKKTDDSAGNSTPATPSEVSYFLPASAFLIRK